MLERFDDIRISDHMVKRVFIMSFGQFLVYKIEWKRVLEVWKKVNLCKWFRVCKILEVCKWVCKSLECRRRLTCERK